MRAACSSSAWRAPSSVSSTMSCRRSSVLRELLDESDSLALGENLGEGAGLKSKMQAQFLLGNLAAMFGNQTDDGGFARCAASMEMQVVPAIAKAIKNLLCKHVLGVFGFRADLRALSPRDEVARMCRRLLLLPKRSLLSFFFVIFEVHG